MIEKLFTRELVEHINSGTDWQAFRAESIQLSRPDAGQPADVPFLKPANGQDIPVIVVEYNPVCDCGELKVKTRKTVCESLDLVGEGYWDTCYECAVVSSD
jgi:hypothetical protein